MTAPTRPVPDDERAFLGRGLAFPFETDAGGDVEMVLHEDDIRQSIRIILGTTPGERVMRPDFGVGLRALVFEPIDASTCALVQHRVEEALVTWEPRIDVLAVRVAAPDAVLGRLDIAIDYRVRATNIFYNLVYPYYLIEGDAA